jgi:hypothetical protein
MKLLIPILLLPLWCNAQVLFNTADSTYIIPKRQAAILEKKARGYDELLPALDSLQSAVESHKEYLKTEALRCDSLRFTLMAAVEAERKLYIDCSGKLKERRKPNIFEKIGYAVAFGVLRTSLNLTESLIK